jgi:hypothetical protein
MVRFDPLWAIHFAAGLPPGSASGKAICPTFPSLQVHNVRQGFFEREDFEAVQQHLPEFLKRPMTFAYLTRLSDTERNLDVELKASGFFSGHGASWTGYHEEWWRANLPLQGLARTGRVVTGTMDTDHGASVCHRSSDSLGLSSARSPIKDFRKAWKLACQRAGVPDRIPHDFRRTAVRNLERAGVPRSVAMKLTGHKTESVYRRYAIVSEADLSEGLKKLAQLHEGERHPSIPRTVTEQLQLPQNALSGRTDGSLTTRWKMVPETGIEPVRAFRPMGF